MVKFVVYETHERTWSDGGAFPEHLGSVECRRRRADTTDISWADARARGLHHDAGPRQARGGADAQRVGHRKSQRIREETGGSHRLFLPVVSGPIVIYDKKTKAFTTYLDFNGHGDNRGLFKKFYTLSGFGNGLNGFNLDPDYATNGKFYTTHMEDPSIEAPGGPQNTLFPGLQVSGYTTTQPLVTPGPVMHQGVLIEWTDTNPSNNTFEGTSREIFRVWLNTRNHQLGEIVFNPTARRGDPDWRVMYIDVGDGGSGESRIVEIRSNPQRLDTMVGKVVRIIPDLNEHTGTSTVSENGRYRIPNDNPFVKTPGARKEIWAYGLRNPHRLAFTVDPSNPKNNRIVASICGLNTWEMISIIHKGANYGFPLREGNEAVTLDNGTTALPADDRIPVMVERHAESRHGRTDLPRHHLGARHAWRRLRGERLPLQRQVRSRPAREIRLQRHHHRPHLVLRSLRHARGRRWESEDDGEDVRGQDLVERSSRHARCGQAALRHDVPHRPQDVPGSRYRRPRA